MSVAANKVDAEELLRLLDCSDIQLANEIESLIRENLQSSREPWLLNSLIESYRVSQSLRCMQILATVQEQHSKILLDRITDDVKVPGQHRLQALALFAFIVRRQPPWLYKVAKHSLMTTITKVLKTDNDVPVLMCGVLIITSIMPVIPVAITPHLSDIFDSFSRLIEFNKRKPGNVPDVYLLHLQVGLYALFHRLYGMYPCNFLTYLRSTYSKTENRPVFEEYIKPMLERVRMHPLLVTASKDKELVLERWRHKEVHDIAVECAKMSLDPIEGWSEETMSPIFNYKRNTEKTLPPLKMHIEMLPEQAETSVLESQAEKVDQALQSQDPFWSPATVCGLSTPPPVPISNAPFSSLTEPQSTQQQQGAMVTQCSNVCLTPHTQVDSPLPHDETERRRLAMLNTHLAVQVQAQNVDGCTPVPPSPLKPDFTSEPPFNTHQMKAIRKINFDNNPSLDTPDNQSQGNELVSRVRVSTVDVTPAVEAKEDMIAYTAPPRTKVSAPVKSPSVNHETAQNAAVASIQSAGLTQSSSMPSVTQLPQYIDSLEVEKTSHDKMEVEDIEVCELTQEAIDDDGSSDSDVGVPSHLPASVEMTAESVAAFMKQVNRIRFNSMNTTREKVPRVKFHHRSSSCPNLSESKENLHEADEETPETAVATQVKPLWSGSIPEAPTQVESFSPEDQSETVLTRVTKVTTTTIQTQTSITATSDVKFRKEVDKEPETEAERFFRYFVETLLVPQCENCHKTREAQGAAGANTANTLDVPSASKYLPTSPGGIPIYTTLSPPEMLDRQILLGGDVHAQEQAKIPLTSQGAVSWTHFGGVPPADEVTILRGQLLLLHNQLMFERHKCELHAKRNRRLLGRTVKTVALEEQYSAMEDQLRLQENEIQNLTGALRKQKQETSDLKEGKDRISCELQVQQKSHALEVDTLKRANDMLKSQLSSQEEENRRLDKELQRTCAKMFCLEEELKAIQNKVGLNKELKEQVSRLNKELLLMGELQQKYQQRLTAMAKSHHSKPETQFILESYKNDLASARASLDQKTTMLDSTKGRLLEAEENLKHKESSLAESKKLLEELRVRHKGEIQAMEDKYQTQKKIQLGLHAQILDLYGQVALAPPRESQGALSKMEGSKIKGRDIGARSSLETTSSASPSPVIPGISKTPKSSEISSIKLQASEGSAFQSYQSERQTHSSDYAHVMTDLMDPYD